MTQSLALAAALSCCRAGLSSVDAAYHLSVIA